MRQNGEDTLASRGGHSLKCNILAIMKTPKRPLCRCAKMPKKSIWRFGSFDDHQIHPLRVFTMTIDCFPSEILSHRDAVRALCEALRGAKISDRTWRNYERQVGITSTQGRKRNTYSEEEAIRLAGACWKKRQNRSAIFIEEIISEFCRADAINLLKQEIAVLVEQYRQCGEVKVPIGKLNPAPEGILLTELKEEIAQEMGYAVNNATWVSWRKLAGIKRSVRRCSETEAHKLKAIALAKKQSPCMRLTPEQVDDLSARKPSEIVEKFDQLFYQESLRIGCLGRHIPRLIKCHLGRHVGDSYMRALAKRKREKKYKFFNSMANAAPRYFSRNQYYSANQVAAWLALAEEWENIRIRERTFHKRSARFSLPPNKEEEEYRKTKKQETDAVATAIKEETVERVFARNERARAAHSPHKGMWCLFTLVLRNGGKTKEIHIATKDFDRWMKAHYYSPEFPPEVRGMWWSNSAHEKEGWLCDRAKLMPTSH